MTPTYPGTYPKDIHCSYKFVGKKLYFLHFIRHVYNLFQDLWNSLIILGGEAGCLAAPLVQTDRQSNRQD